MGLPAKDYMLVREVGASFAFQGGVPIELIKILSDWHLDAILLYISWFHCLIECSLSELLLSQFSLILSAN